jgi:arginine/lysine/ornithine decarboxylase
MPLIVDEAWGAHLPFHEDLPTWAMDAGADVCVVSVHKMGTGFEQGSVFHQQGGLVDPDQLSACADMLMTTSPNVMIYAALDGWRRQMAEHGHALLGAALGLADRVRAEIGALPGLHVLREELLGPEASHDLDPLHVVIDVSELDVSGYDAADWLRGQQRIDMGLSDHRRIEATLSVADDDRSAARLVAALRALTKHATDLPRAKVVALPSAPELELEPAMLPRDAFFAAKETVDADKAVGRICAEQITPYPPGIPVIIPGERVTEELLGYLRSGLDAGMQLPDPADPSLGPRVRRRVASHGRNNRAALHHLEPQTAAGTATGRVHRYRCRHWDSDCGGRDVRPQGSDSRQGRQGTSPQASRAGPGGGRHPAEVPTGRDEHLPQRLPHVRRRYGPAGGGVAFLHSPAS